MKICIIGPGIMNIPPKGWGGVEALIWNYKCELERQNHEVLIVNKENLDEVVQEVNEWKPDFTHLQYDLYADMMIRIDSPRAMTSHYPYVDYPDKRSEYMWIFEKFAKNHSHIFTLSDLNSYHFSNTGVRKDLIWTWINGVCSKNFSYTEKPRITDRSLCLGKVEPRKQQTYLQSIDSSIDFVGPMSDTNFYYEDDSYLGSWTRDQVYKCLTDYPNLVLFSDGESAPQVTAEALIAGCGIVVSKEASANLDTSLPFIDIVDRNISSSELANTLEQNRKISIECRQDIRAYGIETFDIEKCAKRYIDKIQEIISNEGASGEQT